MASKIKFGAMTLAELRELIGRTTAEIAALERAPVPLEEAQRNLAAVIERLASLYTPDAVLRGFTRTPAPGIDMVALLLADPQHDTQDFHATLASLFGDVLLEHWHARLQAQYHRDAALRASAIPTSERPARLAALRETLHELEVAEEKLIVEAERRGQRIDRRPDARPEIIFDAGVLEEPALPAA